MADEKKSPRHTIDDHMFGEFYAHEHGPDADHEHDDIDPGPLEENPIWQRDNVALTSVGIDIGSSGTQVIFSTIHLQRVASSHASRYVIVDRKTAYESPVAFTPYDGETEIDARALGEIIDNAYAQAAVRPADIDTGVVILTGEALRRENAEAIAEIVAQKGGDFVTATAGNHMEAMLAAYGSGAAKASHDGQCKILNLDIGGGTTKMALCENGQVRWTAALHVGGRLIATEDGHVSRAEPVGRHHARAAGIELELGSPCPPDALARIAAHMGRILVAAVATRPMPQDVAELFLTDTPDSIEGLAGVMVSGGVGEYVAERESRDFGDLGYHLGPVLRAHIDSGDFGAPLIEAAACIRATALGASEYSVQLSGQTSTITSPGRILPRRSMQVLKPGIDLMTTPAADEIARVTRAHFEAFDLRPDADEVALAFEFNGAPDYASIRRLADGIVAAMRPRLDGGHPLYVMIDGDIAQTLGGILRDELKLPNDLLVLDGLSLRDFDYIDLGKIRLPSFTVPVTVKSLLFSEDPRGPRRQERIQFQPPEQGHSQPHGHTHDHSHGHAHHHGTVPAQDSGPKGGTQG
ncbi:ethanolamine ammonia-lyase reactivating factor EutA [Puniceibacterium sp. IMCC21224]|uniref:ethanolamine ammonia-lyase reactivating factor EutA n=1 Tax=Puniceibacterium sp. IMCC21224 TaxID=1618204 RepID=UPI00064D774C|nr:ethanolamine ammonia-lyase reactivating factor EutA [Puniceibacterium sp. IMCC21224]KMK65017.1 ethanolamine utilization protein, possible chaperonin protecting lyase from inhibition [Puniceibacterium sp. IMCC21224]